MVPLRSWPGIGLIAVVTFALTALSGVLGLGMVAAVTAILGWFLVVPALAILTYYDDTDDAADADPLSTLRERYASGELTEAEFERRLDRLLETEPGRSTETDDSRKMDDSRTAATTREKATNRR